MGAGMIGAIVSFAALMGVLIWYVIHAEGVEIRKLREKGR
jgi:hypothetical protein